MKNRHVALASAAAALFVAGAGADAGAGHHEAGEKVKCEGVNQCGGKSACKTLFSDCAGKNDCHGKGFVMLTPEECAQAKAAKEAESAPTPEPE